MNATVTQLKTTRRPPVKTPRAASRHHARRLQRQTQAAAAVGVVALALTSLSLSHLAHGVQIVTGCAAWEGWAMAVVTDLGFVALEVAQLTTVAERTRREVARFARPAISGMLVGSAGMNALAFGSAAAGWMVWPAVGLGLAIPALSVRPDAGRRRHLGGLPWAGVVPAAQGLAQFGASVRAGALTFCSHFFVQAYCFPARCEVGCCSQARGALKCNKFNPSFSPSRTPQVTASSTAFTSEQMSISLGKLPRRSFALVSSTTCRSSLLR